ncbi:RNA polymerase subunit sigma-70 [Amycolatopsis sp. NPDC051371]|uniref:RNA polymerase subunit sigma-70 n=1 Tax=Amycolatopsis sp. NPDC051371 TaxID=3155800 RepID=UPI003422DBF8
MTEWSEEFARQAEPFRRELLAHCYRMVGSADDAADLVQETYLRAWRSFGTFEGRSSLRTWLHRIATNACLSALGQGGRRALPSGLGGPADDPDAPPALAAPEVTWLGSVPDAWVMVDPATLSAARDSVRLALVAALQYLPARQRAVLLLREVLGFSAGEVAAMLEISTVAVKSALQRARARLDEISPSPDDVVEPTDPHARDLLRQYIAGFGHADLAALEKALRADAAIELVGTRTWFSGKVRCLRYLAHVLGAPGDWLMTPTRANGRPAAATYYRAADGTHQALGIAVLDVTPTGIARITVFPGGPGLVADFGLPATRTAVPADEEFRTYNEGVISEFRAHHGVVSQPPFPILLLTTTGARTGRRTTVPLGFAVDDRGRVFVVGSKAGAPRHPAWFHNLRADPAVTVELGAGTYSAQAVVTTGEERDRLYRTVSDGTSAYERNTDRVFPVIVLDGVPAPA